MTKPGREKQFTETLIIAVNSSMKEFIAQEALRLYPDSKQGAMSRVVRQAILQYRVSVEAETK